MKVFLVFLCIFLCTIYTSQGQSETNLNKTEEIELTLKKSKELLHTNLDSSLFYSNKALSLSKLIANDTLLAKSYLQKSSCLIFKKEFSVADSLLNKNLNNTLPIHIEGQTLHNLATIQYYKQDFKTALHIYLKAATVLEDANNEKQLVNTYTNIGTINASLKNFKNAQKYLEKALPLSDFNEMLRLQILVNLSNVYYEQKLFKKYVKTITEVEKLAKKYNSKSILSVVYTNQSNYYTEKVGDYNQAIQYGKKAITLKKELNRTQNLYYTYNNVGYSFLKKKNYTKAITYLDSALTNAPEMSKTSIYNNLKKAYSGINNYKKALYYADQRNLLKDSITNEKQKETVAELIEKFESEKKQQQIDILDTKNELQALTIKQQNYLLVALIFFTVLVLIVGYFGFKNYRTKQKLKTLLLQQKLRKTQLNPHFLFNALQSIQNFVHQNNKEKSSSYLISYSKLIRFVLEKSEDNFTSVAEDKLALDSYLTLQQLNLNNSFSYTISIEDNVEEDFDMIPTLITQPFVENAVLHGLKNIPNGNIAVTYYKKKNILYVSIMDNGKGFETKNEDVKKLHKSMSITIIQEQLKNLNTSNKNFKGTVSIESSPTGTKVLLTFIHTL